MGMEFIYRGITQFNEPGIIVVFETSPDKLIRDASAFGWNLAELQDQKKLKIVFTTPAVFEEEMRSVDSLLIETANEMGAQRIFIDGVLADAFKGGEDLKDQLAARRRGVDFPGEIAEIDATLAEVPPHSNEVAQAAGQPVDFPDDKRVVVLQHLKATEKGTALAGGSFSLVLKYLLAPGAFQSGELQGGILVLAG